jgi:hypothetical protein
MKFWNWLKGRSRTRSLLWSIYLDSTTRFGGMNPRGSINFLEFINNCFPYVEALRKSLHGVDASRAFSKEEATVIREVLDLIIEINLFVDKWAGAYTGWLSSFKSKSQQAKSIVHNSNEFIYEEFQSFYRHGVDLYDDISVLLVRIGKLSDRCEEILNIKEKS